MSRWVSLNHARANASANSFGCSVEAPGDLLVGRIHPQREVRDQHGWRVTLRRVEGIRNRGGSAFRLELIGAGRALAPAPIHGRTGFRRSWLLHFVGVVHQVTSGPPVIVSFPMPVPKLLLQPKPCSSMGAAAGSGPTSARIAGAVGLAEAVSAGDERNRLLVVHRHALEGLANVDGGGNRIRLEVRPIRIDVDEAHMHGSQRILEIADAAVALVAFEDQGTRPSPCPSRRSRQAPTHRGARRRSRMS